MQKHQPSACSPTKPLSFPGWLHLPVPSARALSPRVLWAREQPGAAARTIFICAQLASLSCISLLETNVYTRHTRCQLARNINMLQQINKAFPRILRAAQPGLGCSCPPGIPAGFGGCWEHGGKGLVPSSLFICLVLA